MVIGGSAAELSILLLTEDGAEHAHEVMEEITSRLLRLVDEQVGSHRIQFVAPSKDARRVMTGNQWRSKNPKDLGLRQRIVTLGRVIAAKLLEGDIPPVAPQGFVFLHFDGDHAWERRGRARAEKIADLADFLRAHVLPALDHALHEQRRAGRDVDVEAGRKAALLRLRRLTPFYSIEAWLFQNTVEAERLCQASCGEHLDRIRGWAADRGQLDEYAGEDQPKNQLPCIETRDHVALAKNGYPAADVRAAGKSFAAAMENLRRCRDLRRALRRTYG